MPKPEDDISLLFDLFVASNRVRRLIESHVSDAPLRPEEYAVYSVLFDLGPMTATEMRRVLGMPLTTVLDHVRVMDTRGHLRRRRHPRDGRARELALSEAGLEVHRRTSAVWQPMHRAIENALDLPVDQVRLALRAIVRAANAATLAEENRLTRSG